MQTLSTSSEAYHRKVAAVSDKVRAMPGALVGRDTEQICPVRHSFGDGCYVREWSAPAGVLVVSKIHKVAHPVFVLLGECSVLTAAGVERIVAPHHAITPAGTCRVLFTHTETTWVTVHVTDSTDLDEIEAEIIARDFSELEISDEEVELLMGGGS